MAFPAPSIFTKWEFEGESEFRQAMLLSDLNYKNIQNELAHYAEIKLKIEADSTNTNFLLEHKYYEGVIMAFSLLLGYSDSAKTELQRAFEEAQFTNSAMSEHLSTHQSEF